MENENSSTQQIPMPFVSQEFFELTEGGGEVGKLLRAVDWSQTAVGTFETWPQSLKTAVGICLGTKFPMFVWWGRELTVFYNDAYVPLAGPMKHPRFLGKRAKEQWSEIWDDLRPLTEQVLKSGKATWAESMQLFVSRRGFLEETYFTFSYSPIRDESGGVGGIINPCQETTQQVLGDRRLKALRDLGGKEIKKLSEVGQLVTDVLGKLIYDVPFSLLYLTNADGKTTELVGAAGVTPGSRAAPQQIDLQSTNPWGLDRLKEPGQSVLKQGLRSSLFPELPQVPYEEKSDSAQVLSINIPDAKIPAGFLVLGVSPRLRYDGSYQAFMDLVAKQFTVHISNIKSLENEKKRAESLAMIDQVKTSFFSNVSHEFRTPLTLLLGPVEEMLVDRKHELSPKNKANLELVHRNALRLQKMVNSLLDFSRIESGRIQVGFRRTDIAKFTAEVASSFESAMEKNKLFYEINCSPVGKEVFIDPDLWEKLVLNLISNALKFTFNGLISVRLFDGGDCVCLEVQDTGTGIPKKELPRIFERFHRVENARSRTHEGSGIGLALVNEVVKLHGGQISVESVEGKGSTFRVRIPFGSAHLPKDKVSRWRGPSDRRMSVAQAFVEESLHWAPEKTPLFEAQALKGDGPLYHLLIVDDNPDMRNYIRELLIDSGHNWEITAVCNGQEALDAARAEPPDLILTDVMMPVLDGFGLLRAIREDHVLQVTPLIMLSARVGEETQISGIKHGADDYLIKPFSTRELIARIDNQLKMSDMRRQVAQLTQANFTGRAQSPQMPSEGLPH